MPHVAKESLFFRAEHILVYIHNEALRLPITLFFTDTANNGLYALLAFTNFLSGVPPASLGLPEAYGMYTPHPRELTVLASEEFLKLISVSLCLI